MSDLNSKNYRKDIDGLRAVAILAVLIYHFFPSYFPGGFIGVDLFFVISGYLISNILISQMKTKTFTFLTFYKNRFRRLMPALFCVLFASLIVGSWLLFNDEFAQLASYVIGGGSFFANIVAWGESGYFDTSAEMKPLLHLWSLGVEEQFYIFWPLTVLIIDRFKLNYQKTFILVVCLSFLTNLITITTNPFFTFYMLPSRAWELALGGILSVTRIPENRKSFSSILGALSVSIGFFLITGKDSYPSELTLLPVLGAWLIIAAGPKSFVNRIFLSHPILQYIGRISYPLYLWHWPVLVFAKISGAATLTALQLACLMVLSLILASITYEIVEKPIRKRFQFSTISPISQIGVFFFPVLLLICAGTIIIENPEFTSRILSTAFENRDQLNWSDPDTRCMKLLNLQPAEDGQKLFCSVPSQNTDPSVVILGDSVANHLYPGISQLLIQKGISTINIGLSTCPPFRGVSYQTSYCEEVMTKAYEYILSHPQIKTVILGWAPWDLFQYKIQNLKGSDPLQRRDVMQSIVQRDIAALKEKGKNLIVTFDNPFIGIDPHVCLRRLNFNQPCAVPASEVEDRMEPGRSFYFDMFKNIRDVCIFHQDSLFRKGDFYFANFENHLLYRDDHHLSTYGSSWVANQFIQTSCYSKIETNETDVKTRTLSGSKPEP